MSRVVAITGSTHGIGYALAAAFLERECLVSICGRSQEAVDAATGKLKVKFPGERQFAIPCDMTNPAQAQAFWDETLAHFGKIDIWINNAGSAAPRQNLWELPAEIYDEVVRLNVTGLLYGSRVALRGMLAQGYGALYNMEGFGARGRGMQGMTLYGSTKAAVHFINKSLAQEVAGTPLIVGAIAPGMVITEMITRQYVGRENELEKAKPILNIIAERAETVAPVLAEKILINRKNGTTITFASPAKIMLKFLTAPFKQRDLFTPLD